MHYADRSGHIVPCCFVDAFARHLHTPEFRNGYALEGPNEESHYAERGGEPDECPAYKTYELSGCEAEILERDGDLGQGESNVVAMNACPERLGGVSFGASNFTAGLTLNDEMICATVRACMCRPTPLWTSSGF